MLLSKTDKARNALRERSRGLSAAERRVLILCDGRRGLDELTRLLGPDILPSLDRLRGEGYLEVARTERPLAERVRSAALDLLGGGVTPAPAAPPAPAASSTMRPSTMTMTMTTTTPAAGPRRSLAATKMYMLDMLQLQRSAEAAALRVAIQTANGEDAMIEHVLQALEHIRTRANASYAARIGQRLGEVLPEPHLPRLTAMLGPADSVASRTARLRPAAVRQSAAASSQRPESTL